MDDSTFSEQVTDAAVSSGADIVNTQPEQTQTENPNITKGDVWEGDTRYFQTGSKAGQLKPAYRDDKPRELNTTAPLFDAAGSVNPNERTEGAVMPLPPQIKNLKGKAKAKPAEDKTTPDHVTAAAVYNLLLVGTCKLISDEYEQGEQVQKATIQAAMDYFETTGVSVPPWVGLASVTLLNIGAAFKTPKGKSKLARAWDSARAWWLMRGK